MASFHRLVIGLGCFISLNAFAAKPLHNRLVLSSSGLVGILQKPGEERHRLLSQQPDVVYQQLLDLAQSENQPMDIRWKALTAAATHQKELSAKDMMKMTKSKEWFLRNAALISLAEYAPVSAQEAARHLVKDKALVVRSAAVRVLAKENSASSRAVLWRELAASYNRRKQQSLWIRPQIAQALIASGKIETMQVGQLLGDDDKSIRQIAMNGLEQITGKKIGLGQTESEKIAQWRDYLSSPSSKRSR